MSLLIVLAIAAVAILLGLFLAYLPMRILLTQMAKNITAPIREFIQRQRDRRTAARETPDRRTRPAEPVRPMISREASDRRKTAESATPKA
jgi:hypothetical protein